MILVVLIPLWCLSYGMTDGFRRNSLWIVLAGCAILNIIAAEVLIWRMPPIVWQGSGLYGYGLALVSAAVALSIRHVFGFGERMAVWATVVGLTASVFYISGYRLAVAVAIVALVVLTFCRRHVTACV